MASIESNVEEEIVIPGIDRSQLPEHVALRTRAGGVVLIIGTAHISEQSAKDVATLIQATKPQQVLVELCPSRVALIDPENINRLYNEHFQREAAASAEAQAEEGEVSATTSEEVMQTGDKEVKKRTRGQKDETSVDASHEEESDDEGEEEGVKKESQADEKQEGKLQQLKGALSKNGGILAVAISYMYESISSQVKLHVGDDMRTAAEEAAKVGARIVLGDRAIGITLSRAWGGLSTWQKVKLGVELLKVSFSSIKAEDLEMLKNKDILTDLIKELSAHYPSLCTHLLTERDLYLAHQLRSLSAPLSVGVVGLGHVEGIKKHWNDDIDIPSIMTQPPSSSWKLFFFKAFLFCGTISLIFFLILYYIFKK